jgi:hypothetical protein
MCRGFCSRCAEFWQWPVAGTQCYLGLALMSSQHNTTRAPPQSHPQDAKSEDNEMATDNALSTLAALLEHHRDTLDAAHVGGTRPGIHPGSGWSVLLLAVLAIDAGAYMLMC